MTIEANDDAVPGQMVARIISRWDNGNIAFSGSGALIDRNNILTASHVIYNELYGGLAEQIEVYFSYDPDDGNTGFYNAIWANYYRIPPGDLPVGDNNRETVVGFEKDIAVLTLDYAAGDLYGYFGLRTGFSDGHLKTLGYPGAFGYNLTYDDGYSYRDPIDYIIHSTEITLNPGNSGGPAYTDFDGPYVRGVATGGGVSTVITPIDPFMSWIIDIIDNDNHLITNIPGTNQFINDDADILFRVGTVDDNPVGIGTEDVVYRFFNTATGTHFYTASELERDSVIASNSSMVFEGAAFSFVDPTETLNPNVIDVHRFFNTVTGAHFYTGSEEEKNELLSTNNTLLYEGVAYQAFSNLGTGATELWRFFNPDTGTHFYTANNQEAAQVYTVGHLHYEGIAFYILP